MSSFMLAPVPVEAIQFDGANYDEVQSFLAAAAGGWRWASAGCLAIDTPNGTRLVETTGWVVRETPNRLWAMTEAEFALYVASTP